MEIKKEAEDRILEVCKEGEFLRISLISGGCHGFSYKFSIENNIGEEDFKFKNSSGRIIAVTRKQFAEKLPDTILDFKKTISASYFVLESNQFETKCGCGTSFSLKS